MSRNRSWVFTLNNYTEVDENNIKETNVKYMIFGKEIGKCGTKHLQGYVTWNSPITLSAIKKKKGWGKMHLEVAKGSVEDNIKYCSKDNDVFEIGDRPKKGKRTDIENVKQMVLEGKPLKEIALVATSYQSIRYAETLIKYTEKERNWKSFVYWFYGPTGSGKSRCAEEMFGKDAYWAMESNKWWEGYDGHKVIIIDDMRKDFCKFHILLKLLDRYPFRIEVKGGSRQLLAETIIITTCKSPEDLFKGRVDEDIGQLLRRIDLTLFFGNGTLNGTQVGGNTDPDPIM